VRARILIELTVDPDGWEAEYEIEEGHTTFQHFTDYFGAVDASAFSTSFGPVFHADGPGEIKVDGYMVEP
jgi:hypothetical protein